MKLETIEERTTRRKEESKTVNDKERRVCEIWTLDEREGLFPE